MNFEQRVPNQRHHHHHSFLMPISFFFRIAASTTTTTISFSSPSLTVIDTPLFTAGLGCLPACHRSAAWFYYPQGCQECQVF